MTVVRKIANVLNTSATRRRSQHGQYRTWWYERGLATGHIGAPGPPGRLALLVSSARQVIAAASMTWSDHLGCQARK